MKKYVEHGDRLFFKISSFVFMIPASIAVQYSIIINVPILYTNRQMGQIFAACVIFIGCIFMEYLSLVVIRELKIVAVVIELTEDKVIGYSRIGKNRWEMRYEDIASITPKQNGWAVILKDKNNKKLMISLFAHPFGDCMETIQKNAVNAKNINFGNLRERKGIWKMA